ncbi:MAG: tetratricopeptide repeat protein, partial [Phycisphaerae bacterium]
EVITVAAVAINSHVVLELAKDCARYDPDLFIVYLGNNEVVGPFGPGTVLKHSPMSLSLIRTNIALKSTRIGQLLESILDFSEKRKGGWGGMEMFLEQQVRYDSDDLQSMYDYFQRNLEDIYKVAHRAGADVIVSNVGVNLKDCPPFASQHKKTLSDDENQKWQQLYQQAIDYDTAEKYEPAITSYQKAAEIDETFADLQFRLARCYWKIGRHEAARKHYIKAREYDTLRFRADSRINQIIRETSENKTSRGIFFVDSVSALEQGSPNQITGEELFYEHVHLNFSGNYIIARTIFEQMAKILPKSIRENPGPVLNEEQCAEELAYTDFDKFCLLDYMLRQMLDEPPFTNQLYHDELIEKTKEHVKEISGCLQPPNLNNCLEQYKKTSQIRPNDWQLFYRYSLILSDKPADLKAAEDKLSKSIQICPYNPNAYISLVTILYRQNRINDAETILKKLLEIKPNSAFGHFELGKIYLVKKDYKNFIRHTAESLSLDPGDSIESYIALSLGYENIGNRNKAIEVLRKAVENLPEEKTAKGHVYLSALLSKQAQYSEALEEAKLALRIDPGQINEKGFRDYLNNLEKMVQH